MIGKVFAQFTMLNAQCSMHNASPIGSHHSGLGFGGESEGVEAHLF